MQPAGSAHLCPARGACATRDTTRQPNTHNTESRTVCYPWHPWFGRSVVVYETLVKYGHSVCRCGLEEKRTCRAVEIPTWMFESATCSRLRVMNVPLVDCDALSTLTSILRSTPRSDRGDVLQAQHRSLLTTGGADAMVCEPSTSVSTHAVSPSTPTSIVSEPAASDPTTDYPVAGTVAPRAPRSEARRRPRAGGR